MLRRDDFVVLTGARIHPHRDTIEQLALEDAARIGLLTDQNKRRFKVFATLVGYVYPTATIERARVCALWCNWLYFFDDAHDEREGDQQFDLEHVRASSERAVALLRDGVMPVDATALDRLALEFRAQVLPLMGPAWLERFCKHVHDYLIDGTLVACRHWMANTTPTLENYLPQREWDSAVQTACALIEVALGLTLSEDVARSKSFLALNAACSRTVAYFNDLASYPKEVIVQKNPNNLVHVLATERRLPIELVIPEVVVMVNDEAQKIEKYGRLLALEFPGDEHVAAYVEGIKVWQRGNIEMSLTESRYRSTVSPFVELRPN